jgi:hypothetical protein
MNTFFLLIIIIIIVIIVTKARDTHYSVTAHSSHISYVQSTPRCPHQTVMETLLRPPHLVRDHRNLVLQLEGLTVETQVIQV